MERLSHISVSSLSSPILICSCLVVALFFTLWVYRRTIPPVPAFVRGVLVALRTLALILIVLIFFRSVFRLTGTRTEKPAVAVFVDNSSSMRIQDDGQSRDEKACDLLLSEPFIKLGDRMRVFPFVFSDDLAPMVHETPDSIPFDGTSTDLARPFDTLPGLMDGMRVDGILILSDGAQNKGEDPVRKSMDLGMPVHTITIGQATQKSDLILSDVFTNEITYVDNQVPVEFSVQGPGYGGRRVTVRLHVDDKVVDERALNVPEDGRVTAVRLHHRPDGPGLRRLRISVSTLEGELTFENNVHDHYIRVLESRMRVLLLAGAPSPDLAFLKRIMASDEDVQLWVRTQRAGALFYEGAFPEDSVLRDLDAVVLLDMPTAETGPAVMAKLEDLLVNSRKPFLLFAGMNLDPAKWSSFEPLFPVSLIRRRAGTSVLPRIFEENRFHPILLIAEDGDANSALWHRLPPVFSSWDAGSIGPGVRVLVTAQPEILAAPSSATSPLILARHVGDEKCMCFVGYGIYRWDLLMWGVNGTNEVLVGMMRNTLRWLATREEEKPIRLDVNKSSFRSGENALFSAQVYDEMYRPVENAAVRMTIESPSGDSEQPMEPRGGGMYTARRRVLASGPYRVQMEAFQEGELMGRDEVEFAVSSFNPEFVETRANPELMARISAATGGMTGPPDSLAQILESLDYSSRQYTLTKEILLMDSPVVLIAIVLLLSAEWFIRKRKGMV